MLAAGHRLRDTDAFRRTVRSGRRCGGAAVVVHLLPAPDSERADHSSTTPVSARVGFVVSKAVGNAVVRNRVKRRLRHLVGGNLALVPSGAELVVRALPASAGLSTAELGADLVRCLGRVSRPPAATRTGAAS